MNRRTRQGVKRVSGAAAGVLLLAACGGGQPPSADWQPPDDDRTSCGAFTPGAMLEPFRGPTYDYEVRRSPEELAQSSELVISGTISAVREGRTMTSPASAAGAAAPSTVVVAISSVTAAKGHQQDGHDGTVYLELPAATHPGPVDYSGAFPAGSRVVAYLVPASSGGPDGRTDVAVANPAAGRPAGQALYLPAGPQGLALQVAEDNVVWPLIGAQAQGCIVDALPGGHLLGQ